MFLWVIYLNACVLLFSRIGIVSQISASSLALPERLASRRVVMTSRGAPAQPRSRAPERSSAGPAAALSAYTALTLGGIRRTSALEELTSGSRKQETRVENVLYKSQ